MSNPVPAPGPARPSSAPIPERLYHQLSHWGVEIEGARAAVLGSRNGRVNSALARLGAQVVAVMDAPQRSVSPSRTGLLQVQGPMQEPPLQQGQFDLVLACNRAPSLVASRLLRPGGWLVLAGFQWLPAAPGPGRVSESCMSGFGLDRITEEVSGVHPSWLHFLQSAGTEGIVSSSVDLDVPFDQATWRASILNEAGRRGFLAEGDWKRLSAELDAGLTDCFHADLANVPHRLFATAGRMPVDPE